MGYAPSSPKRWHTPCFTSQHQISARKCAANKASSTPPPHVFGCKSLCMYASRGSLHEHRSTHPNMASEYSVGAARSKRTATGISKPAFSTYIPASIGSACRSYAESARSLVHGIGSCCRRGSYAGVAHSHSHTAPGGSIEVAAQAPTTLRRLLNHLLAN